MITEFLSSLFFTLVQAVLSAFVSTLLALFFAPGYCRLSKFKKLTRSLLLFPQLVSPVLIVLGLLIAIPAFPFGLAGVVGGHAMMNAGLGVLILGQAWEAVERDWWRLSEFFGASRTYYIRRVMLPLIMPQIRAFLALVFSFCLSSLFIPLVLGGGPRSSTLEVLIYEKIKASADIKSAIGISIIQLLLQLIFFLIFLNSFKIKKMKSKNIYEKYGFAFSAALTLIFSLFLFFPFVKLLQIAFSKPFTATPVLINALVNSMVTALLVSLLIFMAVACWNIFKCNSAVLRIPQPSHVFLGLLGILVFGVSGVESKAQMFTVLAIAHFFAFYLPLLRFGGDALIDTYKKYSAPLSNMGAHSIYGFRTVLFPLSRRTYFFLFLLAFCWSLGEFTLSALLAPPQATMPLLVQSFLGHYRLEEAAQASLLLFGVALATSFLGEALFYERS